MENVIHVRCFGLPCPGFPIELINLMQKSQVVRVPFIVYRGTTYGTGAYVLLERDEDKPAMFHILDVKLQPHLLLRNPMPLF